MAEVTYNGLTFEPYITRDAIAEQVKRVAAEIRRDIDPDEVPLFLCVLNGAYIFAADLFRECGIQNAEIAFIRFKSYEGTSSTGKINEVMGLDTDIKGRTVIIIEDIVDTGLTADHLRRKLLEQQPKRVAMATLLFKPDSLKAGEAPEYVGFNIPSKFIIGYGLDLDGLARNLPDIYVLKS